MPRRFVVSLLIVLLGVTAGVLWSRRHDTQTARTAGTLAAPTPRPPMPPVAGANPSPSVNTSSRPTAPFPAPPEERSALADGLNARDGNIQRDLLIVEEILSAWRTNFPHVGNPVGENNEITAVLTGANPLHLALIPKDSPAINADGELCDRWGTPFRFHQLSGEQMELRSAGPDRKFGTADDALFTP